MIVHLPDGGSFRLLTTDKLKLSTKIRIQRETGYGPVKLAAGLAGIQSLYELIGELPDASGAIEPAMLEKLAEQGDIDLLALGCLFWGSRLQQGEPNITFMEACDFEDGEATYELEPQEKRAAAQEAATARPTQAALALSPGAERNSAPPRQRPKST